ncbi:hypothetical protein V499_02481 [Pseudogymnoascus sp. VKM F-103]|uniref:C2H2-type domain-containing protein n=1 Tax=Pseudogymnoascus verrucosus TaxID=342668 RepID=A0A1B8GGE3_9PEZI|nr:uncharacterized protein VE01_06391 [Pseudogymnoascus verrucosus]KFY78354.1 hypothetical protein V499_02481 [Pseudogymnoascus sp. VKM F-103]OBT94890.1 hypothetical protein VE01_06391 [Pseudogymnoascus verrucosus]
MDIPRYASAHRSAFALPEIYIQTSNPSERKAMTIRSSPNTLGSSPPSSASPMSIPNARDDDSPPPPLPPPRYVNHEREGGSGARTVDPGWEWSNSREEHGWGKPSSVKSGSSLYGSFAGYGNGIMDAVEYRRGSSASTIKSISGVDSYNSSCPKVDEGYASLSTCGSIGSTNSRHEDSIPGRPGFQSSVHEKYRSNTQTYDKSVLQKLNSRRGGDISTSPRSYGRAPFSKSFNDSVPSSPLGQKHGLSHQKPLSLPAMNSKLSPLESPISRWASGGSAPNAPLGMRNGGQYGYRSPSERDDMEQSPRPYSRQTTHDFDDASSTVSYSYQGSHYTDNESDFPMEETGFQRLHIDDGMRRSDGQPLSAAAGQKRRASSPPLDDGPPLLHTATSLSDLYRRREQASRASPAPRNHSNHGSISSSTSGPRSASLNSVPSLAASSMSTVDSYGRLSPGGRSPGAISPRGYSTDTYYPGAVSPRTMDGHDSPFSMSLAATSATLEHPRLPHRAIPDSRPIVSAHKTLDTINQPKNGILKVQSGYVCDCCPKKPKKFDTEEALAAHESEKQYECAYCKNRFKNKNEAERHQNSLHLRRHSWSCAALTGYVDAFHTSPTAPNDADTCGYCGDEFARSGTGILGNGQEGKVPTERDWEARIQHLVDLHKFRECNHTKKFFRADHFRQHLKHSHAGTSGKWTNMLENACMKDEPLPVARINEEDE